VTDGLIDPAAHEPLIETPWDEGAAQAAIQAIVCDLEATFDPAALWPNHPSDLEDSEPPEVPFTNVYLGASGVVHALARLARSGRAATALDLAAIAAELPARYRASDELGNLYPVPQPSLMMGESGILLVADEFAPTPDGRERLLAVVAANEDNPAHELCWGSPGTMVAALELLRRTADQRAAKAWRRSAERLLAAWTDEVWTQELYGRRQQYVGPGHGFAGCVQALLQGRELLDAGQAADIERRAIEVLGRHARRADGVAQWPPLLNIVGSPPPIRTQWCHGAPGMVVALAPVLARGPEVDELLAAGGELTWQAGPLVKGPGLCHGTAGNGFAFLALLARTGDERWLERARRFAMHAIAQVERERTELGRGRATLYTGDPGVALYLDACLEARAGFPVLDGAAV
jgi:Lanthionine synthetase C-like protein